MIKFFEIIIFKVFFKQDKFIYNGLIVEQFFSPSKIYDFRARGSSGSVLSLERQFTEKKPIVHFLNFLSRNETFLL